MKLQETVGFFFALAVFELAISFSMLIVVFSFWANRTHIRIWRRFRGGDWELWKFRQEDSCGMEHDSMEWHRRPSNAYPYTKPPRDTLMRCEYITGECWRYWDGK